MKHSTTLQQRLAHYTRSGEAEACWSWTGSHDDKGYPQLRWKGKLYRVSRLLAAPTENQVAMHRCNNANCVNPAHIKAGTRQENNVDALRDGLRTGATAPQLTMVQVEYIRNSRRSAASLARELAKPYSVVYSALVGRTYTQEHSEAQNV